MQANLIVVCALVVSTIGGAFVALWWLLITRR